MPQGAATTIYACVCPRISTDYLRGAYLKGIGDCCSKEGCILMDLPYLDCGPASPTKDGQDVDKKLRQELWKVTEQELNEALAKAGLM